MLKDVPYIYKCLSTQQDWEIVQDLLREEQKRLQGNEAIDKEYIEKLRVIEEQLCIQYGVVQLE